MLECIQLYFLTLFILTVISKVRKYFILALNFVPHFAKNSV